MRDDPAPAAEPLPPQRVVAQRYRLLSELGRGGMGIVWRAQDEILDREVAVKEVLMPAGLTEAERAAMAQRSVREARSAARLSHPGVVTVFDVVVEEARPWVVMELVRGDSLNQVIRREGPLPPDRAARIGLQLLGALGAAHAARVRPLGAWRHPVCGGRRPRPLPAGRPGGGVRRGADRGAGPAGTCRAVAPGAGRAAPKRPGAADASRCRGGDPPDGRRGRPGSVLACAGPSRYPRSGWDRLSARARPRRAGPTGGGPTGAAHRPGRAPSFRAE